MIKAILFDLDGIVIAPRKEYYSVQYAREHDVPLEDVNAFFLSDFKRCVFGECDLKESIAPHLSKWKWKEGVDTFLTRWFETERTVDEDVLRTIDALRAHGFPCYIATRQEKYRMQYLLDTVGLAPHFDGVFVTHAIGFDKSEQGFWDAVFQKLGVVPEEVLYFDDTQKNVEKAQSLGVDAHFYDRIDVLEREVGKLLSLP